MRAVFAGIIDYAGLFPPAMFSMAEAVRNYDQYRRSEERWLLGRFVVAAMRLEEFGAALQTEAVRVDPSDPWGVSAVMGAVLPTELGRIAAFNSAWVARGVQVDAIEHPVASTGQVTVVGEQIPQSLLRFLEVPPEGPYTQLVGAIRQIGAFAKIRTGGITQDRFPEPEHLAAFLLAATKQRVAFKATAGLHHPFRGTYALTYEEHAERHVMFGYINILIATAELLRTSDGETAQMILEENDPAAFQRSDDSISWRDARYSADELAQVRAIAFLGFGACSFREPVDEFGLAALA